MAISAKPDVPDDAQNNAGSAYPEAAAERKRVVVVGLGMVGIAFM